MDSAGDNVISRTAHAEWKMMFTKYVEILFDFERAIHLNREVPTTNSKKLPHSKINQPFTNKNML